MLPDSLHRPLCEEGCCVGQGSGRPRAALPERPNLVQSWLVLHGELAESALYDMNAALGTAYTMPRIREWAREKREPSTAAINYMLRDVLQDQLKEAGLSTDAVDEVLEAVRVPQR